MLMSHCTKCTVLAHAMPAEMSLCPHTVCSEHAILAGLVGLAPGTFHTVLVRQDGSVWSTGVNSDVRSERFVQLIPNGATAAAAGNYYSMVLKEDGRVWVTGKNARGELSIFGGSKTSMRTFSLVKIIVDAKVVAAGTYHSMILTQEGFVWVTGWNKYGQLGDGSTNDRNRFIVVIAENTGKYVAVAAGDIHSIALKQDGSVWAAGRNSNGQLGDGSKDDRNRFVKVMSSGAANVAAGGYHSIVLKQDGSVWATGFNKYGQLGDGTTTDQIDYVQVVSGEAKAVAAGSRHSMVLKQDGSVWATGNNKYGQIGDGSLTDSTVFSEVISQGTATIAAGALHSMLVKQDGSIWATGSNEYGQLGYGATTIEKTFVKLAPFGIIVG